MLSRLLAWAASGPLASLRAPRERGRDLPSLARRVVYFWAVWSALLLVHEAGHGLVALRQGQPVRRITVGAGPALWRGRHGTTEVVLRLVPLAGVTTIGRPRAATAPAPDPGAWRSWGRQVATLGGGLLATLAAAGVVAGLVWARERRTATRWLLGRYVVADAAVLTVLNFLPIPPLDGGRALLATVAAWRGAPVSGDALFWLQASGLALAVVPMAVWTRWTARIDAAALRWGAPAATG